MKFFRCRTCGYMLVHDGHLPQHVGHTWTEAANGTVFEWLKTLCWRFGAWLRKK